MASCCSIATASRSRVDRKSTRLNSSHTVISYAVFCLKKKKINEVGEILEAVGTATQRVGQMFGRFEVDDEYELVCETVGRSEVVVGSSAVMRGSVLS